MFKYNFYVMLLARLVSSKELMYLLIVIVTHQVNDIHFPN